jgi:hypothetical protein
MDPRLKIVYLVALGVALFTVPWPVAVLALLALQPILALFLRVPPLRLWLSCRMLAVLLALLVLSYGLVSPGGQFGWFPASLADGGLMAARILALVWASVLVQHSGPPGEVVRGLVGLGMPRLPAMALDVSLGLLGDGSRPAGGPGGGIPGSGMGGGRAAQGAPTLKQVLAGDLAVLLRPLEMRLRQAEDRARELAPDLEPGAARDLALIAGLSVLSQTVRFLKILPGIPFAPGHKSVILLPLYVVAADRTQTRWGSTALGTTQGMLAFAFGDGMFGVFEVFKFITPGLAVDLLWPLFRGRGAFAYAILGLVAAVARFATIALVALLVKAPPVFWAMLAPIGVFHVAFGAGSGLVTYHLLRALGPSPALPIT